MSFNKWISQNVRRGGDANARGDYAEATEVQNELTAALATGKITYEDWDDTVSEMFAGTRYADKWKNRNR